MNFKLVCSLKRYFNNYINEYDDDSDDDDDDDDDDDCPSKETIYGFSAA